MVADDPALEHIVFGKDGILSVSKPGLIHVSHSTISTALARRLAAEHAQHNQGYLSVPVFGRPDAAESKKLVVVAGGPSQWIDRCRPLFDSIGRQTFVVGPEAWQQRSQTLRQLHDHQYGGGLRRSLRYIAKSRRGPGVIPRNHEHAVGIAGDSQLWTHHRGG